MISAERAPVSLAGFTSILSRPRGQLTLAVVVFAQMDLHLIGTFLILVGLELVLGIDNILLVSVISDRCAPQHRDRTRKLGIVLAAVGRLALLAGVTWVMRLTTPVFTVRETAISWKDLILLAGGFFLLFKAVKEMHHTVEHPHDMTGTGAAKAVALSVGSAIAQILALDLVFSIDSVITAVGLTQTAWVLYGAVLASVVLVLTISSPIARFIRENPALKVLALAFLVVIGVTIVLEGMHHHLPKTYVYLPLGFCLVVELLQMRQAKKMVHPS
jgi:predicted tellurium resistance membrane protein TerC